MVNDKDLVELADPNYWNERYRSEQKAAQNSEQPMLDSYEWFRSFEQLRTFFEYSLPPSSSECHILHLGCGNSVHILFLDGFGAQKRSERLTTPPKYRA